MQLLHFSPPIYSYRLVFPRVPGVRHSSSSPQDEPFPVQIPSHTLSLSPLPVPYLENSSAALSQAARADTSCCARAAPDSLPRPALTQRRHGRHLMQYSYTGWSVIQLCHSQMDYANALSWDEKQTSRRRTGKTNLMNHELDVLPPHAIWLLSPFPAFPPPRTPPLSLQSLSSGPFSFCLSPLLSLMSYPALQWLIKTFDTCRCRIKTSSQIPAERAFPTHLCRAHTCHLQPHQCPDGASLQQHLPARPSATTTRRWMQFHPHYLLHTHPQPSMQSMWLEGYIGDSKANVLPAWTAHWSCFHHFSANLKSYIS